MSNENNCPPGTEEYIIKEGDTLYKLAQNFSTTISALIGANPNIDPNNLIVGDNLCIPLQAEFPSCPEENYYRIKARDTLYKIATKFNISVDDLQEANPKLNPDNLNLGEIICIPVATPPVECPEGSTAYLVQRGDTFYSIARKFEVSVEDLQEANPEVDPTGLLIDQKICIPVDIRP
jgi:LysM repeat protein